MYSSAHAKLLARLVEFILAYNNPVNQQREPHSGKRCSKIRESTMMNDTWSDGPDRLKYNTFSKSPSRNNAQVVDTNSQQWRSAELAL
jgi:hypothetical protein